MVYLNALDSIAIANALNLAGTGQNKIALNPPKILLVDDDPRMLASVYELLRDFDYQLATANSSTDAIDYLSRDAYDVVLLDLQMPGLNGHQVMDLIAAKQIDVIVIVVSGEQDIEAAIGALKRGVFSYLRKPFRPEELFNTVAQAIQKRKLEAEHRHVQYQLECSEKLYRHLVDSLPDLIYTVDPEGRFTYVNDRAEELLGYTKQHLIGEHYSKILHENDLDRARFVFQEKRVGKRASSNIELRLRSQHSLTEDQYPDNAVRILSFSAIALYALKENSSQLELFGSFGVARDVTKLKRAEQQLHYQAFHDILTGLPNRALFRDRLDLAVIHAARSHSKLAVMFVDLDGFKLVNDTLGHAKGDQLLQEAAIRMRQSLRKGDSLARVGGDEFTLLFPELRTQKDAAAIARKFLASLERPFEIDGRKVHISASIGIALYPEDGQTMEDLVRHADIAMYQAKANGKSGYCFYSGSMEASANQKMTLAQELRHAIEHDELEMYYQPQVQTLSGQILGAEALIRWNHPEQGLLMPAKFMPFAEENGLMLSLTNWIIKAVCRDLHKLKAPDRQAMHISVNLSPQCLERSDIAEKFTFYMNLYGIHPSQIEVEITENTCFRNFQCALDQLNKLSQIGINIALDDFGTGYSSLSYLHRLPVKRLKIDRSFISGIDNGTHHSAIVSAVISIARDLGLEVIAEGVETENQLHYLQAAGCTTMQGYYFYRPLKASKFHESLNAIEPKPDSVANTSLHLRPEDTGIPAASS